MRIKQTAIYNDNRIYDAAEYTVTEGGLSTIKLNPDEFKATVFSKFKYLKGLIIRGESTLEWIEDSVYSKYGVGERSDAADFLDNVKALSEELVKKSKKLNKESKNEEGK
jgi:hypothetical protein